jgi:hypothetical protein
MEPLGPAYALGALDESDRKEFEKHLEACAPCGRSVREFEEKAAGLAMELPPIAPSEVARERVLRRASPRPVRGRRWGNTAALLLVLAFVMAVLWYEADRRAALTQGRQVLTAQRLEELSDAMTRRREAMVADLEARRKIDRLLRDREARIVALRGEGRGHAVWKEREVGFIGADLPQRVCVLWAIQDGRATRVGTLSAEGVGYFRLDRALVPESFRVTVEPDGSEILK